MACPSEPFASSLLEWRVRPSTATETEFVCLENEGKVIVVPHFHHFVQEAGCHQSVIPYTPADLGLKEFHVEEFTVVYLLSSKMHAWRTREVILMNSSFLRTFDLVFPMNVQGIPP